MGPFQRNGHRCQLRLACFLFCIFNPTFRQRLSTPINIRHLSWRQCEEIFGAIRNGEEPELTDFLLEDRVMHDTDTEEVWTVPLRGPAFSR